MYSRYQRKWVIRIRFNAENKKWLLEQIATTRKSFSQIAREFIRLHPEMDIGISRARTEMVKLNAKAKIRSREDSFRLTRKRINYLDPERLPVLGLVERDEKIRILRENEELVKEATGKYRRRNDYTDTQQIARLAMWAALDKWDRKRDLKLFLEDVIQWGLIRYFAGEKRHTEGRVSLDEPWVEHLLSGRPQSSRKR